MQYSQLSVYRQLHLAHQVNHLAEYICAYITLHHFLCVSLDE